MHFQNISKHSFLSCLCKILRKCKNNFMMVGNILRFFCRLWTLKQMTFSPPETPTISMVDFSGTRQVNLKNNFSYMNDECVLFFFWKGAWSGNFSGRKKSELQQIRFGRSQTFFWPPKSLKKNLCRFRTTSPGGKQKNHPAGVQSLHRDHGWVSGLMYRGDSTSQW